MLPIKMIIIGYFCSGALENALEKEPLYLNLQNLTGRTFLFF